MTLATAPLTAEHIPQAAVLLDRWYSRAARPRPAVPPTGEELLAKIIAEPYAEAACARAGGGVFAGYLAALPLDLAPEDPEVLDSHPRSALVPFGGHALRSGRETETLRALYTVVAERLVAQRRLVHYVDLPADESAAMAWFRLGFGLAQVRGLMPVKPRGRQPRGVEALTIRRAGTGELDLDRIGRMAAEAARQQQRSAVFLPQPEPALAALRKRYAVTLGDPRSAAWVAARRGEEIGMVLLARAEPSPVLPEPCAELSLAYVAPSARGEGISRILLATALAWAFDNGYRNITARWHAASPVAAGHWPAVGFKPVAYRLQRVLDPRLH
ncbi:GNAT family N-acetyltransferase [Streptomyces sp. NBC_01262]|uniref:GNAT family N-acetyltransferase n=1 Tax=Streptomyces sp. NBC_01262 TaxID=2903803 RepID=UPI002E2EE579|nr:GNAT family N-acetyltransferase [Streptomyces sp. NBC_01262]